jgi:hypothetical protein
VNDSEAIEDLDNLLKGGMLHETHHEAFHLLVEMGECTFVPPLPSLSISISSGIIISLVFFAVSFDPNSV